MDSAPKMLSRPTLDQLRYVPPTGPYEPFRVGRVGDQDHGPPQGEGGEEKPPKKGLAAYLLNLLKKTLDFLLESSAKKTGPLADHILALKQAFEVLKKEDRSEDVQFLKTLSSTWLMLLEDSLSADSPLLNTLLKKIQQYPEWEQHTFGYYLTEYAGQKWIPFPYMELIEHLHSEHLKNPSDSALSDWTSLIDELLSKQK